MKDTSAICRHLESIVGPQYATDDPAELWCYTGNLLPRHPQLVVRPANVEEVVAVVEVAAEAGLPIIPRGLATRSTPRQPGVYPPIEGGLILETNRLKRIRQIDQRAMLVTAEAGVTMAELANRLAPLGCRVVEGTMAPFCATVGSLTGVGPGLRKYGRRERQIVDVEVVLSSGQVIHTANVEGQGLDLTPVFVAAQGLACLGVVTAVTYRLHVLPERFEYLDFEFDQTADAVRFLLELDRSGPAQLPALFQVNVWPEAVFRLYARMPWVREQSDDYRRLLDRYPPFPADVVGIILEGTEDQVTLQRSVVEGTAAECGGVPAGPEPIRDYFVNRNWTGNTKCHEDVSRRTTSWAEPFFLCAIEDYPQAKAIAERAAAACGFEIGERFWARGTLRDGLLGYTSCVTFDDTEPVERERASAFVESVLREAAAVRPLPPDAVSDRVSRDVLRGLKERLDPLGIMNPGALYMD
jgi:FAD/FMN-containing dehydrogenase